MKCYLFIGHILIVNNVVCCVLQVLIVEGVHIYLKKVNGKLPPPHTYGTLNIPHYVLLCYKGIGNEFINLSDKSYKLYIYIYCYLDK